jgi:glycosyltransferase involved in cell wall biosynthesis/SAM-dependent methyltransferase
MQMTWAELAKATPEDFSPVAWPCGGMGSFEHQAQVLFRVAGVLANSVNGPLVGLTVAVCSSRPEHAVLARLLACHGAAVSFFCPEPVVWDEAYEPLFHTMRSLLSQHYDHLDPAPLQDVTAADFTHGPCFSVVQQWPGDGDHPCAGRCQRVFVYDLLGDTPEAAGQRLAQFATLLTGGGFLELFGGERGQAVLEHVLGQAFSVGFGAQAACSSQRGDWRLSMCWLGSTVHEYPRVEDHAQLLAHCEARLHFAAHFVAGAEVLEAGCGSGVGTKLLLAAGAAHVVGLDYNPEALALARSRAADPRAEYHQWDLNQTPLPLADGRFDVVVCLEVLEHVREQRALLAELRRVLKPGGRLIVSVPDRAYEEEFAVLNGYRNTYHVRVPDRSELGQLLEGFTQLRYAWQIDFLGSCVVEDGATGLGGDWREQSPGPRRDTVETILAVGVKPPESLARAVLPYHPHLRVFDNALHLLIEEKRYVRHLEAALANEKVGRWVERNQYNAVMGLLATSGPLADPAWQKDLVRTWFGGNTEAYACCEVLPGDWIPRMEEILASGSGRSASTTFRTPAHWEFAPGYSGMVLRVGNPNPAGVKTVLYPRPGAEVGIRSLWGWHRRGARAVWFAEGGGWKQYDLLGYLGWRVGRWVVRRLLPCARRRPLPPGPGPGSRQMHWVMALCRRSAPALVSHPPSAGSGLSAWQKWVASTDQRPTVAGQATRKGLKTVHYIGALHAGGAERQLCNLAIAQKGLGLSVRVVTTAELAGSYGHYAELLAPQKVSVQKAARMPLSPELLESVPWHLLRAVPASIQPHVVDLIHDLLADRPAVLHCWLDQPNVIGAIAGLLVGVPRIVLSTRNSNPTNFPRLLEEFFQDWYQLASRSSRVHLIANSHSGASSYAEWLRLPLERFHVVLNGVCFDHFPEPTAVLRREARQSFGLSAEDPVVCGAFRLAAEKQPALFLDVVRRVRTRIPRLRVLLAGEGDLEPRVRQEIREYDMEGWVQLLGRRPDIATVFLAADASLLTSTLEGCPNVALESQYLGVPIVATDGGGTGDAISHGTTGFLAGVTDAEGLAAGLTRLLLDDGLRQRMREAGPSFVRQSFGLGRMAEQTMAVYEATGKPGEAARQILPLDGGAMPRAA